MCFDFLQKDFLNSYFTLKTCFQNVICGIVQLVSTNAKIFAAWPRLCSVSVDMRDNPNCLLLDMQLREIQLVAKLMKQFVLLLLDVADSFRTLTLYLQSKLLLTEPP